MDEIQERFCWRLEEINNLLKIRDYEEAFKMYSELIRLFNRLHGYSDYEKLEFYKKIKLVGDSLLLRLAKNKLLNEIKKNKFSKKEFKERLKRLAKEDFNKDICDLIKGERFEEVLKFYENK